MNINKCAYYKNEADVTEIIPNLWLGNVKSSYSSEFIKRNNIKYIIRLMPDADTKKNISGIKYVTIPIEDEKICINNNKTIIFNIFDTCSNLINKILSHNKGILIHCKRGHHRSGAIVASYIIKYMNIDFNDAIEYINKRRPCALRRDCCITKRLFEYNNIIKNKKCNKYVCNSNKCIKCKCILS